MLETNGSYQNAGLIQSGAADAALIQSDVAYLEYFKAQPFEALASLYTEPVHVAARRELGLERLSDLLDIDRKLEIAIGERGSGSASHALTVLSEMGLTRDRFSAHWLSLDESLAGMRSRDLDLVFRTSAAPIAALRSAAQEGTISIVRLDRSLVRRLKRKNPFFTLTEIPYDLYSGSRRNLETVGTRALLVARPDIEAYLVERILDAVYSMVDDADATRFTYLSEVSRLGSLDGVPIVVNAASQQYHATHSGGLVAALLRYRRFFLPVLILVLPLFVLYRFSRVALFIHQFALGRIIFLLVGVWLTGASIMHLVEGQKNSAFRSFGDSAIAILHYLFSGLEAKYPITLLGNVVAIVILSLGVAVATLFTATIVSLLIERALNIRRLRVKPRGVLKLRNHVILTGWSSRAERVLKQLRSDDLRRQIPVVVVTNDASKTRVRDKHRPKNVWALEGDCCMESVLRRADIDSARAALVLSDEPNEPRSDLRSVAITLAIERLAPQVHTVVEALRPETIEHLRSSQADEVVDVASLSEKVISQSLVTPGIMDFYEEVLSFGRDSQELYALPLPSDFDGLSFRAVQRRLLLKAVIPLGFRRARLGQVSLNPGKSGDEPAVEARLQAGQNGSGDHLILLADDADVLRTSWWRRLATTRNGTGGAPGDEPPLELSKQQQGGPMQDIRIGICGWSDEAREIIHQLQDPVIASRYRFYVTVICDPGSTDFRQENGDGIHQNVGFVFGDCTKRDVLQNAGIDEFRSLVVLAQRTDPQTIRYSDHRSLMVALAAADLHPGLHVIAEVLESKNKEHFERLDNVEIISVEDLAEKILAQAVISPGITEVFDRLLTATRDSNEVYLVPVPGQWVGRTFEQVYRALVESDQEVILLGYQTTATKEGRKRTLVLNPTHERSERDGAVNCRKYELQSEDSLVTVAYEEPAW